jgi:hypothetical protein
MRFGLSTIGPQEGWITFEGYIQYLRANFFDTNPLLSYFGCIRIHLLEILTSPHTMRRHKDDGRIQYIARLPIYLPVPLFLRSK